ncbi:hypothetical protein SPRG_22360 [Saprolegnia parasitica CBS 223.65]|uniref:Uncharacterized protein n=1 Tax=Saprolegnia parasitica (strain CBS 223.65) TaxID=695850 RepID=A0A067BKW3_SAPPC|nr:hypothetical protein SPRG_22360 [Saprolegnia parasitica CBS 223.65]KDO18828.1 hypothetical protein SPRG_22360 [Saprolegnia parasitica CBS 223.65]|eukprot:XP_012210463.1 hypothetical protein SPRG_22360 [Saprolegnia parasitica CBS 223.65]
MPELPTMKKPLSLAQQLEAAEALAQQLQADVSTKRAIIQSLEGIAKSDAKLVRDCFDQRTSVGAVFSKTRATPTTREGKKELVTTNAALVLAIADIEANLATLQATIQSLRHKPTARLAQRRLSTLAEVFETDADVGRLIEQFELLLRQILPKSALHSIKAKRILIALETIDGTSLKSIEITLGDYLPFLLPLAPSTSKKKSSARHPDEDEDESYFSHSAVDALVVKFTSRLRPHRHMPAARHHSLLVASSAAATLPVDDASAHGKPSSHGRSSKVEEFAGETAPSLLDAPKLMTPDQLLPINENGSKTKDLLCTKTDTKAPEAASRLRRASVSLYVDRTSGSAKAPRDAAAHLGEQAIARRTEMSRMNDFERIALADKRLKTDGSFS